MGRNACSPHGWIDAYHRPNQPISSTKTNYSFLENILPSRVIGRTDIPMWLYSVYQIASKESKPRQRGCKKMLEVLFGPVGPIQWPTQICRYYLPANLPTYMSVPNQSACPYITSQWMIRRCWISGPYVPPSRRARISTFDFVLWESTSMGSPICIPWNQNISNE